MADQYEIPKEEDSASGTFTYNVWLLCTTDTACVVPQNCIVDAADEQSASEIAIKFLTQRGMSVTLMQGAPPLPALAVCAVPYRVERASRITVAGTISAGRTN